MQKTTCVKCLLFVFLLLLFYPMTASSGNNFITNKSTQIFNVTEQTKTSISVNVVIIDAITSQPVQNATVILWDLFDFNEYRYFTNERGECNISGDHIKLKRSYWLYAYRGDFERKIVDYVPVKFEREIYLERVESKNVTLQLVPGALIEVEGVPYIAQSPSPEMRRMIIRVVTETKPFNYSFVREYGSSLDAYFLGLNSNVVAVPANIHFFLEVEASYLQREHLGISVKREIFRIDNKSLPFLISQGGYLSQIKIPAYSLRRGLEYTRSVFADVSRRIDGAQAIGFTVFDERRMLSHASQSIIEAESLLYNAQRDEDFEKVWLTLRKALNEMDSISRILGDKLLFAESQAIYLPAVLSVFSVVVSFFFFEEGRKKAASNVVIYIFFLIILYYTHPGTHVIIDKNIMLFIYAAVISFTTFSIIIFVIPRVWKERTVEGEVSWRSAITIIFSMGKRQIKRKKLRGFFTIFSVGILVLAFTSLTSFGTVFGAVSDRISSISSSDGILVRRMVNGSLALFSPLGYGDIVTISEIIPMSNIAQRWKNFPKVNPIAQLINSKTNSYHFIYGVIAVSPESESTYTRLNELIDVGEYLSSEMRGGVLISSGIANKLGVKVNDNVTLKIPDAKVEENLIVKGLINDERYNALADIDGSLFGPYRLLEGGTLQRCNSTEIIVINLKTAEKIRESAPDFVLPSEIVFQPATITDMESGVKRLVLTSGYDIFVSLNNMIVHYHIGSYIEFKGVAELLIPIIMVILNVSMVMVNSAYERSKEIRVLSMLGLNPTHIGLTFVAEATVIGMVGGSLGYLAGLSFYRIMNFFGHDLMVREKLEWWWSAIGFALAILISVLSATRPAVMAVSAYTPSKIKKVKRTEEEKKKRKEEIFRVYQARELSMPIKVLVSEKVFFVNYFLDRLNDLKSGYTERVENIENILETENIRGELVEAIKFVYLFGPPENRRGTKNTLTLIKSPGEEYYRVRLSSEPASPGMPETAVERTIDFVQDILISWAKDKRRIIGIS